MSQAITGLGTKFYIGPAVGDVFTGWTLLGELASFDLDRAWDAVEVTNFDSGVDKEAVKGLRNPGTFTLHGNRLQNDPGQIILRAAFDDPRAYRFLVSLPFGEQWFFHGLVLSVDPPLFAPGKALRFLSKVQVTGPRRPYPGVGNATGEATKIASRTLSSYTYGVFWKNFALTGILPQDAQIQGMYPTIIVEAHFQICDQGMQHGNNGDPVASLGGPHFDGPGFRLPFTTNRVITPHSFDVTQFWGSNVGDDSIGTSLADLTDQIIFMSIESSTFESPITDRIAAEAVGIGIYYTSETPLIDPLIPPPFDVPAGQGLAWAVPFSVHFLAENQIFGTTTGTAAELL